MLRQKHKRAVEEFVQEYRVFWLLVGFLSLPVVVIGVAMGVHWLLAPLLWLAVFVTLSVLSFAVMFVVALFVVALRWVGHAIWARIWRDVPE